MKSIAFMQVLYTIRYIVFLNLTGHPRREIYLFISIAAFVYCNVLIYLLNELGGTSQRKDSENASLDPDVKNRERASRVVVV